MSNLSYDLCKQLKDAGFAQKHNWDGDLRFCPDCIEDGDTGDVSHCPTLSELIEACDAIEHDGFQKLETDGYGWDAFSVSGKSGCGQTPEEAVANLWLALNT